MSILMLRLEDTSDFEKYHKYLKYVSGERASKIARFRSNHLKITSLFAELLTRFQISQELNVPHESIEFAYNPYGKPLLRSHRDYWFSISHSGSYIAFVSDTLPIGIDIESIGRSNLKVAKRFFTPMEYEYILDSKTPTLNFFEVWTKKEAYLKMLGMGLYKPMSSFNVLNLSDKVRFYTVNMERVQLSVCYNGLHTSNFLVNQVEQDRLLTYFDL